MDVLLAGERHSSRETQSRVALATPSASAEGIGQMAHEGLHTVADPTPFARQSERDAHHSPASDPLSEGEPTGESRADVQSKNGTQVRIDGGIIIGLWRQRQDLLRAHQRLDLQCQAVLRRDSGGDKAIAGKRWAAIKASKDDPAAAGLLPYMMAMEPLEGAKHAIELQLCRLTRKLPIWTQWGKGVRGLGELSLAGLIGECGRPISDYRSVSALWKRMGLAVISGERQRRVPGDEALIHGYAPQRRSFAYVLSTSLMRSQKPDDRYRMIYDDRKLKALEKEWPKARAHNHAMRLMVKELLKHLWIENRRIQRGAFDMEGDA